ncbi:sulfur oxidation protein SoxZ [Sulfurifustis variabilis]|uniref:Sulfur oxidation protein SoxZ n=1 Tax=Sulfurifustis variabilis TaxID=1675686 RepID=A0A1B4V980_9GAMM|nr:thiosulfate oxidation carrier complex protein SoxZ [Sulfurifustis variabilis]BAU49202.1 sulfur oxidation protein SoxZ [Sulfurifustis variabilis]
MSRSMKVRSRPHEGGEVELVVLVNHPMENGLRIDKQTGQKIPAHFIQEIAVAHNGRVVATVATGGGVSQDPLLGFRIPGTRPGDTLTVSWRDNRGESDSVETTVSP